MASTILDVLGIGLGPFNISLNCLLAATGIRSFFIEQKEQFSWHPHAIGGNLQVSWLKDCVSAIDPTSIYSFLNYINKTGLFYQFAARRCEYITRDEYSAYLKWIVEQFENTNFGDKVYNINITKDGLYNIESEKGSYLTKSVVIATGCKANIPNYAANFKENDVFHSSLYMKYKNNLKNRVLIVGNGQSACEIVLDLIKTMPDLKLTWIARRSSFHSLDDNAMVNALYAPFYTNDLKNSCKYYKKILFGNLLYTSDGISSQTANELFELLYARKNRISLSLDTSLENIFALGNTYKAHLFLKKFNESMTINVDKIILCTGYKQQVPEFLQRSNILANDAEDILNSDFSCKTNRDNVGKIYIQNCSRSFIGPIDSNLSIMPWRNAMIVNSLLGKDFYKNIEFAPFLTLQAS